MSDNFEKWVKGTAAFMTLDRPDVFPTNEHAENALREYIEKLRNDDDATTIGFASYYLSRYVDEDEEEFAFNKKISSYVHWDAEDESVVYDHVRHTKGVLFHTGLPSVLALDTHFDAV